MLPSTVNGTELSAEAFCNATHLRYAQVPPNCPTTYDRCSSCNNFSIQHALSCKVGGLIISRHDEIKDELGQLAGKALKPSKCSSDAPTAEADLSTTPLLQLSVIMIIEETSRSVASGHEAPIV
eukprot:scaffold21500_cov58-Attheya_sp.AAC.2